LRGLVKFAGFTNARIPWPTVKKCGSASLILCGDLIRAVKTESKPAVAYYWGVCDATVKNWKRILKVPAMTEGSRRLVRLGVELARLPQCRAKLSAALRGHPVSPRHILEMRSGARRGYQDRRKARRAEYLRTGRFPPATVADLWLPEEEKLLGSVPDRDLVPIIGRTLGSIRKRRMDLNIRVKRAPRPPRANSWTQEELAALGTGPDRQVAQSLGRSL